MSETHSRPLTGSDAQGVPWREWSQGNCTTIGQKVAERSLVFSNLNTDFETVVTNARLRARYEEEASLAHRHWRQKMSTSRWVSSGILETFG